MRTQAIISSYARNSLGTVNFIGAFGAMAKPQTFTVYPIPHDEEAAYLTIQSNTRIGRIDLATGNVTLTRAIASGANFSHLVNAPKTAILTGEQLLILKAQVMATAHGRAGNNGVVFCDNSGVLEVFEPQTKSTT